MADKEDLRVGIPSTGDGGTKLLDLGSIKRKTKNMKDEALFLPSGSYLADPTALGYPLFVETSQLECAGHDRPAFWEIGEYDAEPDTLTARPSLVKTNATIGCRWDLENKTLYLDMYPIIIARQLVIPPDTHLHIPISKKTLNNGHHVILIHLGQLTYQPVEKTKSKKETT